MRLHVAIVALSVLSATVPCGAVVLDPFAPEAPRGAPPTLSGDAAPAVVPMPMPVFEFGLGAPSHRGPVERVLTLPNVAVVLAGMAWMALVRRRLAQAPGE